MKQWFTPKIMLKIEKIMQYQGILVRAENIREIPMLRSSEHHLNANMLIYQSIIKDKDWASLYYISAAKAIVKYNDELIDLTSIWPERQLVVAYNPKSGVVKTMAFIFSVHGESETAATEEAAMYNFFQQIKDYLLIYREEHFDSESFPGMNFLYNCCKLTNELAKISI